MSTRDEAGLQASVAHIHAALGTWLRELAALAAWRPAELDAWGALSRQDRAAVAAAGILGPRKTSRMATLLTAVSASRLANVPLLSLDVWIDKEMRRWSWAAVVERPRDTQRPYTSRRPHRPEMATGAATGEGGL